MNAPSPTDKRLVVFLFKNTHGEYCLHFRDGNPGILHPMQWSFFGGHIEPGESVLQTARRETEEELGVPVCESDFVPVGTFELPGKTYDILECRRPIEWDDIRLREGAGCAFFNDDELRRLENCSPLIEWLRGRERKNGVTGQD